jgi:Putative Flp pilus-assembly TadE/G-like
VTRERGQVTIMALGLALVAFAVAGLASDGARAWILRRTLQNAADSAALAAAGELDRGTLYGSGGRRIVLDPVSARRVAGEWLARRGVDARAAVRIEPTRVTVVLRDDMATSWLGLVGIESIPVAVTARAAPVAGG